MSVVEFYLIFIKAEAGVETDLNYGYFSEEYKDERVLLREVISNIPITMKVMIEAINCMSFISSGPLGICPLITK